MGKLKLKKAGKLVRRAGGSAVKAAGGLAKIAEAVTVVGGLVEWIKERARRRRAPPNEEPGI